MPLAITAFLMHHSSLLIVWRAAQYPFWSGQSISVVVFHVVFCRRRLHCILETRCYLQVFCLYVSKVSQSTLFDGVYNCFLNTKCLPDVHISVSLDARYSHYWQRISNVSRALYRRILSFILNILLRPDVLFESSEC